MADRPLRPRPSFHQENYRMSPYTPRRTVSQTSPNIDRRSSNASSRSASFGNAYSNATPFASSPQNQRPPPTPIVSTDGQLAHLYAGLHLRPEKRDSFELLLWYHLMKDQQLKSPVIDEIVSKMSPHMPAFPAILIPALSKFINGYGMRLWPVGKDNRKHLTKTSWLSERGQWKADQRHSDNGPCYYNDTIMTYTDDLRALWKRECDANGRVAGEMTIEERQAYSPLGLALQSYLKMLLYRGRGDDMWYRANQVDPEEVDELAAAITKVVEVVEVD